MPLPQRAPRAAANVSPGSSRTSRGYFSTGSADEVNEQPDHAPRCHQKLSRDFASELMDGVKYHN
jgi:hypothetical protein